MDLNQETIAFTRFGIASEKDSLRNGDFAEESL